MNTKIKVGLVFLVIVIVIFIVILFYRGMYYKGTYCGDGKNSLEWNANSNCICPPNQLKQKFFVMCDPTSCPPFYKCINKEECKQDKHSEIVNNECVKLSMPECGWPEDYKKTDISCKQWPDCYNNNTFYKCCKSMGICLDYTESNLRENPESHCKKLNKELCIKYNEYCKWENEGCTIK